MFTCANYYFLSEIEYEDCIEVLKLNSLVYLFAPMVDKFREIDERINFIDKIICDFRLVRSTLSGWHIAAVDMHVSSFCSK